MEERIKKLIEEFPWNVNGDRVIILPDPPETVLPSGLFIPDSAQERPQCGHVIAVGPEISMSAKIMEYLVRVLEIIDPTFSDDDDDPVYKANNKPGDRVLFGKYAGFEIEIEKVKYLVMRSADIMATLKNETV